MNGTPKPATAPGLPLSQMSTTNLAGHRGELERRLLSCPAHADRRETLRATLSEVLAEQTARRTLSR
jgi:hypothetical protein